MVNVEKKPPTFRQAQAKATVSFPQWAYEEIKLHDGILTKGSIFETARIAGIMAAKKTSDLIPLCHQIPLSHCGIEFEFNDDAHQVYIFSEIACFYKTGVEMEALTAVNIAALTLYDMCKALTHHISIHVHLIHKSGGVKNHDQY